MNRLLVSAARPVGAVLWPSRNRPDRYWTGPAQGRWRVRLWRALPWLTGLYGLITIGAASGAVINDQHRMVGGVAFLLLLPFVGGSALCTRRPLDAWRAVTLWVLVVPYLIAAPVAPVPLLEPWEWCIWVPVLLCAGAGRSGRDAVGLGLVGTAVLILLATIGPWPVELGYLPLSVGGMIVPLVVGASIGARLGSERALAAEQARAAEAQAEQGALAERARIAREMHDVVAHHMSMIAVRCETAPYRLPVLNTEGRTEIAEIGTAARAAMSEMQALLGVLRDSDTVEVTPQPSLDQLPALLSQARDAGLQVDTDLDPGLDTVTERMPAAVGLSLYRIAQEALTNSRRHAPGAAVSLRLRRHADSVELVVRSAPGRTPAVARPPGTVGAAHPGGHGLVGMRERAALHGGDLSAGPDSDGGFTVRVVLPAGEPSPTRGNM
ncbi:sensor histidine kinase [Pseudonocardia spinosispora]|uniref:sensor histidine kinase n=1 Tax=Pseudonocardia spinosispora TaxID=103441 RepID=UPI00041C5579|nr:histidine kinase [Pseudonocardia spinosispora]